MEPVNPYQTPASDVATADQFGGFDETGPLSPGGRFGRLSYLAWGMVIGLVYNAIFLPIFGLSFFTAMGRGSQPALSGGMLGLMFLLELALLVVAVLFGIRRLHDIDTSGWWMLLMIVPLANLVLGLILVFKGGTAGPNRFGQPRITRGWEKVLGYIAIGFAVLGIVGIIAAIALPALMGGHRI